MTEKPDKFKNLKLGKPWTEVDNMKLKKIYKDDKKNLAQVAEELGRDKNKIISELIGLKLVKDESEVRGINEYKTTDYYKLVQEYYSWQKDEKNKKIQEEKKTIKKIANNEIFDKEDFKSLKETINYLVEVVQEQTMSIKLLKTEIEQLNKNKTDEKIEENIEENNQKLDKEYKTIKHKKKEYIVYKNNVYAKTENNKKGVLVGTFEDGKVCLN